MTKKNDENEIKIMLARIDGKLDQLTSEQHEIKDKVEKIEQKVDTTHEKGLNNAKDIEFINKTIENYKLEIKEKHSDINSTIDNKADETMRKVKVWLYSTIGSVIGLPIVAYILKKLFE